MTCARFYSPLPGLQSARSVGECDRHCTSQRCWVVSQMSAMRHLSPQILSRLLSEQPERRKVGLSTESTLPALEMTRQSSTGTTEDTSDASTAHTTTEQQRLLELLCDFYERMGIPPPPWLTELGLDLELSTILSRQICQYTTSSGAKLRLIPRSSPTPDLRGTGS